MFEKPKRRFAEWLGVNPIYLGTDKAFEDKILEPLKSGTSVNKFKNSDVESILAAVTCIKVLGDTMAKLPLNVYQSTDSGNVIDKLDYRYDLLHYSPDGIITSQAFFGALEYNRNLKGNSFARIYRNKQTGRVEKLSLLPSNMVGGYKVSRDQLFYIVYDKDKDNKPVETLVNASDILHFKMISKNGIWGINPIEAQRLNLSTLYKSKSTVDNYYENNAFTPKVLKSQIPDAQFQKPFAEAMSDWKKNGRQVGPVNAGTIGILPPFTEIQELALDPVDAKFIESMKFDNTQIASFYGVPPDMVGVFEFSKYNNVEQAQLNFRNNTISSICRMYRQELEFKLLTTDERKGGKSIEFVTQAMMELDVDTRTKYYQAMFGLGCMTQNQINLLEGLPTFEDGNKHYMSSQVVAIENKQAEIKDVDVSSNL